MRNVAFSILLFALALMQIAVVSTELSHSRAPTAVAQTAQSGTRYVVASSEAGHKASGL